MKLTAFPIKQPDEDRRGALLIENDTGGRTFFKLSQIIPLSIETVFAEWMREKWKHLFHHYFLILNAFVRINTEVNTALFIAYLLSTLINRR